MILESDGYDIGKSRDKNDTKIKLESDGSVVSKIKHENDNGVKLKAKEEVTANEKEKDAIVFDRTSCKVMVYNVLKFNRGNELELMIENWLSHVPPNQEKKNRVVNSKKPPQQNWVKITLEAEDMVEPFIDLINKNKFKNRNGGILFASVSSGRKRSREDGGQERCEKKSKNVDVRDMTTPLWKMKYSDQLEYKWREMVKRCAKKIIQEINKIFRKRDNEAKRK